MPYTRRWSEVTSILRLFHVHMGGLHSVYLQRISKLADIGIKRVDSLGDTSLERSDAAIQLVNTALIAPAAVQHLPTIIVERNEIEHHQMRPLLAKNP